MCCLKACEKWRVDVECYTAMVSRLTEERQQALQHADEVRHCNIQPSPDDYLALSTRFIAVEPLIPLGAEFNALSPLKLRESAGDTICLKINMNFILLLYLLKSHFCKTFWLLFCSNSQIAVRKTCR